MISPIELTSRQNIASGGKYEKIVGYSRAVRLGNFVFVSGTTGVLEEDGSIVDNSPYAQTKRAIQKIQTALGQAGGSLSDIVRTRVFIAPGTDWREVARAHAEFFGDILPASSMLGAEPIDKKMLVEIEADAVVG